MLCVYLIPVILLVLRIRSLHEVHHVCNLVDALVYLLGVSECERRRRILILFIQIHTVYLICRNIVNMYFMFCIFVVHILFLNHIYMCSYIFIRQRYISLLNHIYRCSYIFIRQRYISLLNHIYRCSYIFILYRYILFMNRIYRSVIIVHLIGRRVYHRRLVDLLHLVNRYVLRILRNNLISPVSTKELIILCRSHIATAVIKPKLPNAYNFSSLILFVLIVLIALKPKRSHYTVKLNVMVSSQLKINIGVDLFQISKLCPEFGMLCNIFSNKSILTCLSSVIRQSSLCQVIVLPQIAHNVLSGTVTL